MDYLTRRSVAAQGIRGVHLGGRSNCLRLSALGVRVGRAGMVSRLEITTALEDIGITVALPAGERLDASTIEALLADKEPGDLRRSIDAFLDSLSQNVRHDLHPTPKGEQVPRLSETRGNDGEALGPSDFAKSVANALEAAREEAGRIARLHGTPLWCCNQKGECVAVWPVPGTPGQIFPGGRGTFCFVPCSCLKDGVVDGFAYGHSGWAIRNVRLNATSIDSGVFPENGSAPLEPEAISESFIRQLYRETWEPVDHHGRKGKE